MTSDTFVKAQLCAYAYQEAAHCGGYASMLAIAHVIRNRVHKGWRNRNWMEVLNAASESSAFMPQVPSPIDVSSEMFRRVLGEVESVYAMAGEDQMTKGGLYFIDSHRAAAFPQEINPWFQSKILRDRENHAQIAQVGTIYIFS